MAFSGRHSFVSSSSCYEGMLCYLCIFLGLYFSLVVYCYCYLQSLLLVDAFVRRQQDLEEEANLEFNRSQRLEADVERLSSKI